MLIELTPVSKKGPMVNKSNQAMTFMVVRKQK